MYKLSLFLLGLLSLANNLFTNGEVTPSPSLKIDPTAATILSGNTVPFLFSYPAKLPLSEVFTLSPLTPSQKTFELISDYCTDSSGKRVMAVDRVKKGVSHTFNLVNLHDTESVECSFMAKVFYISTYVSGDSNDTTHTSALFDGLAQPHSLVLSSSFSSPIVYDYSDRFHRALVTFDLLSRTPTADRMYSVEMTVDGGNVPVANITFEMLVKEGDIRTQIVESSLYMMNYRPTVSPDCKDAQGEVIGTFSPITVEPDVPLEYIFLLSSPTQLTSVKCTFELFQPFADYTELTLVKSEVSEVATVSPSVFLHYLNPHVLTVKTFGDQLYSQVDFVASNDYERSLPGDAKACFLLKGFLMDDITLTDNIAYYTKNNLPLPSYDVEADTWRVVIEGNATKHRLFTQKSVFSVKWTLCHLYDADPEDESLFRQAKPTPALPTDTDTAASISFYTQTPESDIPFDPTLPVVVEFKGFHFHSLDYPHSVFTLSFPIGYNLANAESPLRAWCRDNGAANGLGRGGSETAPLKHVSESTVYVDSIELKDGQLDVVFSALANVHYSRVQCQIHGFWDIASFESVTQYAKLNLAYPLRKQVFFRSVAGLSADDLDLSKTPSSSSQMNTLSAGMAVQLFTVKNPSFLINLKTTFNTALLPTEVLIYTYKILLTGDVKYLTDLKVNCYSLPPLYREVHTEFTFSTKTLEIILIFENMEDYSNVDDYIVCEINESLDYLDDMPYTMTAYQADYEIKPSTSGRFPAFEGSYISTVNTGATVLTGQLVRSHQDINTSYKSGFLEDHNVSYHLNNLTYFQTAPLTQLHLFNPAAVGFIELVLSSRTGPTPEIRVVHGYDNTPGLLSIFVYQDVSYFTTPELLETTFVHVSNAPTFISLYKYLDSGLYFQKNYMGVADFTQIVHIPSVLLARSKIAINPQTHNSTSPNMSIGTGTSSFKEILNLPATSDPKLKFELQLPSSNYAYGNLAFSKYFVDWTVPNEHGQVLPNTPEGVEKLNLNYYYPLTQNLPPSSQKLDFTLLTTFTDSKNNNALLAEVADEVVSTLLIPDVSRISIDNPVIEENTLTYTISGVANKHAQVTVDLSNIPSLSVEPASLLSDSSKNGDFFANYSFAVNTDSSENSSDAYTAFTHTFTVTIAPQETIDLLPYSGSIGASLSSLSSLGSRTTHALNAVPISSQALYNHYSKILTQISSEVTISGTPSTGLTPEELEDILNAYKDSVDKAGGSDDVFIKDQITYPTEDGDYDTDVDIIIQDPNQDFDDQTVVGINDSFKDKINNGEEAWKISEIKRPIFFDQPYYCKLTCGKGCDLCPNEEVCQDDKDCRSDYCNPDSKTCAVKEGGDGDGDGDDGDGEGGDNDGENPGGDGDGKGEEDGDNEAPNSFNLILIVFIVSCIYFF